MQYSRKTFLQLLGTGALAVGTGSIGQAAATRDKKGAVALTLGLASYSLRSLSLDQTIAASLRLGLKHVAFKSMHMPLELPDADLKTIGEKVRAAGLDLYGAGVIYMKTEAEVHNAFRYAKAAGLRVIIGVPNHDLLPLVEQQVKATNIKVAIHNHGPGDEVYPSPDSVYEKVKNLDSRIGLCIDIGHTIRIGQDPVEKIRKYADRLYDLHLKDVTKAAADGDTLELGRGIIDIPAVIKALKKIRYVGVMALEYEKDGDDPLPGLAESVGYARAIMKLI